MAILLLCSWREREGEGEGGRREEKKRGGGEGERGTTVIRYALSKLNLAAYCYCLLRQCVVMLMARSSSNANNQQRYSCKIMHHYALLNDEKTNSLPQVGMPAFSMNLVVKAWTPKTFTSFRYSQTTSTRVHPKNTRIKYWSSAELTPHRIVMEVT